MQTLILPGYSSSNKEWVDSVAKEIKSDDLIRPFYWIHWTDESQKFDPQEKADLIVKHLRGENANIIAKSVGTLIACLVYKMVPNQIEKIVLCGIPITDISSDEKDIIRSVSTSNDKVLVLQNINDPHGKYDNVKDFGNVTMTDRNDHNYPFYSTFQEFLK